jgi:hypothetical protein
MFWMVIEYELMDCCDQLELVVPVTHTPPENPGIPMEAVVSPAHPLMETLTEYPLLKELLFVLVVPTIVLLP